MERKVGSRLLFQVAIVGGIFLLFACFGFQAAAALFG